MGRKPTPTIPIPTSLPDCRYLYTIIQGQRQKPRRQLGCLEVIGYLGQRRESFTRTRRYQFRERPSILLEKGWLPSKNKIKGNEKKKKKKKLKNIKRKRKKIYHYRKIKIKVKS